jgi:plastocyanin
MMAAAVTQCDWQRSPTVWKTGEHFMAQDQLPATNETAASSVDRRRFLHGGAALGFLVISAGSLATAAQQSATPSPAASPVATPVAAVTVKMTSQLRFEPAAVRIKRGETITWVNASPIPHTTTDDPDKNPVKKTRPELSQLPAGADSWDSGLLQQGQSFSHTFTMAGEYKYFCIPHILSGMLGTITVEP